MEGYPIERKIWIPFYTNHELCGTNRNLAPRSSITCGHIRRNSPYMPTLRMAILLAACGPLTQPYYLHRPLCIDL